MMIHEITEKVGRHKRRKRIGRGVGSGHGKTSGRGHKGAGSRSGFGSSTASHPAREGGQTPLFMRVPKRGFSNARFAKHYAIVNVQALDARFEDGAQVNAETLAQAGLIRDARQAVKILGQGETTKKLNVTAAKCSGAARAKIEQAGGTVTEAA